MKKKFSLSQGFTLIELLVVISIIGLLSSFAVVSLNSARVKARDALRQGDMAQIRTALYLYYDDNEHYPICGIWNATSADFGATPTTAGAQCYTGALATGLSSGSRPYMAQMPKDPKNTTNDPSVSAASLYRYVSMADGSEYALVYQLEENPGVDRVLRGW